MKALNGKTIILAIMIALAALPAYAQQTEFSLNDSNLVTLDKAIEIALQNNYELKQAAFETQISKSKVGEAKSARGFGLSLSGNYAYTINGQSVSLPVYSPVLLSTNADYLAGDPFKTIVVVDPVTFATSTPLVAGKMTLMSLVSQEQIGANFIVKKPIWTFGKIENNIKLNRLGVQSSSLDERIERLSVGLKVRQAYYQYLLALEFYNVTNDSVAQAQAHYDAASKKNEFGVSPKFDVIRAEVDVATARENLAKAKKGVDLASMSLCNAMGIDVNSNIKVTAPANSTEIAYPLDTLVKFALSERVEFKQLKLGKDQALLGAKLAKQLPTIGFQGTYALKSKGSSFGQEDTWQLAVAAEVPLFDSGKAKTQSRQARLTAEKLGVSEQQLRDGVKLQVSEAFLSMNEAKERMSTTEAILNTTLEAVRMAEVGFKEGVTPNLDVLDAQHSLNGAKLNSAQARFDVEIAKAKLLNSVGVESADELKGKIK
jgi:outer membrane protein